jgi:predicted HTH domain antitoxin
MQPFGFRRANEEVGAKNQMIVRASLAQKGTNMLYCKHEEVDNMKQVQLNICLPDMVGMAEGELKMMLASRLYETGRLSLGQAADAAGFTKRAFAEMLGQYDLSLFSQNADELQEDIRNA